MTHTKTNFTTPSMSFSSPNALLRRTVRIFIVLGLAVFIHTHVGVQGAAAGNIGDDCVDYYDFGFNSCNAGFDYFPGSCQNASNGGYCDCYYGRCTATVNTTCTDGLDCHNSYELPWITWIGCDSSQCKGGPAHPCTLTRECVSCEYIANPSDCDNGYIASYCYGDPANPPAWDQGNGYQFCSGYTVHATCGTSAGGDFSSPPDENLCGREWIWGPAPEPNGSWHWAESALTGSVQDLGNQYRWTCEVDDCEVCIPTDCFASKNSQPVDGACGSNEKNYPASQMSWPPRGEFCSAGSLKDGIAPVFPAPGGTATWKCRGSNGGMTANCAASRQLNGQCGSAENQVFFEAPSANLCEKGTPTPATAFDVGLSYTWSCLGAQSGSNADCSAWKAPGQCGTANARFYWLKDFPEADQSKLCDPKGGTTGNLIYEESSAWWAWTCAIEPGGMHSPTCMAYECGFDIYDFSISNPPAKVGTPVVFSVNLAFGEPTCVNPAKYEIDWEDDGIYDFAASDISAVPYLSPSHSYTEGTHTARVRVAIKGKSKNEPITFEVTDGGCSTSPSAPGATQMTCDYYSSGNPPSTNTCWKKGPFPVVAISTAGSTTVPCGTIARYEVWASANKASNASAATPPPITQINADSGTSFTIPLGELPSSPYKKAYFFRAVDTYGNESTNNFNRFIRIDSSRPTIDMIDPVPSEVCVSAGNNPEIYAADGDSGLRILSYKWDEDFGPDDCSGGTEITTGATVDLKTGGALHTLYACAMDNVGIRTIESGQYCVTSSSASIDISNLNIYKSDGTTIIINQGSTDEKTIILKPIVIDTNPNKKLEVFVNVNVEGSLLSYKSTYDNADGLDLGHRACASDTEFASCVSKVWYSKSDIGDWSSEGYQPSIAINNLPNGRYAVQVFAREVE